MSFSNLDDLWKNIVNAPKDAELIPEVSFKPCPFCGNPNLSISLSNKESSVECKECRVFMYASGEITYYKQVEGNLFEKVPGRSAAKVLEERWNNRVDITKVTK